MKKTTLIAVLAVLVALGVVSRRWWWKSTAEVAALASGPAPAAVVPDSTVIVLTGRVGAGGTEPVLARKRGRIRNVYFSPGEYVRRGAVMAKLADYNFVTAPHDGFLGERQVTVGLLAKKKTHVQAGDSVRVWATARPTRVVTGVAAPATDTTGGITLEIRLPSRSPLRLGEVASVQLKR